MPYAGEYLLGVVVSQLLGILKLDNSLFSPVEINTVSKSRNGFISPPGACVQITGVNHDVPGVH